MWNLIFGYVVVVIARNGYEYTTKLGTEGYGISAVFRGVRITVGALEVFAAVF